MKLSNNAVTTVLHDKNLKYLKYFEKNLKLNKKINFDIFVFCHGAKKKNKNYKNFTFIYLKQSLSIVEVRKYILNFLIKENYKKVIFTDLEDFFKFNRVEKTLRYLDKYDIVFNNINLLKNEKIVKKNIFNNSISKIDNLNYLSIVNSNFLGFCNSGLKVKLLSNIVIPKNIIAVDWWIFTLILMKKRKVKFLKNISTNYRLDEANILGISKKMSKKKLKLLIDIKLKHYLNLVKFCKKPPFKSQKEIYLQHYKNLKKLRLLSKNSQFNKFIVREINKKKYNFSKGWFNELPSIDFKTNEIL